MLFPQVMNVVGSATAAMIFVCLCAISPSNGQPHLFPELQSSPAVSTFNPDPRDEFSERWFLLRLQKLDRLNQPKVMMQLAGLGLRMHQGSIRLRMAYATAGNAANRCDWIRQHLLFVGKNAVSPIFKQLARDLTYRCFGGWEYQLAAGAMAGRRQSINGRSSVTSIAAEAGSKFYNDCLAYRGLCNPDRHIHVAETRRSAIDVWGHVQATLFRQMGADFYTQILVQIFRRSPSKARFQAKGAALKFHLRRPLAQRTYVSVEMETGVGEFQRGVNEEDLNQQHMSVTVGLGHRLAHGWPEMVWQVGQRRSFSSVGTTSHTILGTKVKRRWDNDWVGEIGVEHINTNYARGAARPNSVADIASVSLRIPLAKEGAVLPAYQLEGALRLSTTREQFSRPLFDLAERHVDVTRSSALSVFFIPTSHPHLEVEISFIRDRTSSPNPLIAKQVNNVTFRFNLYKFSS